MPPDPFRNFPPLLCLLARWRSVLLRSGPLRLGCPWLVGPERHLPWAALLAVLLGTFLPGAASPWPAEGHGPEEWRGERPLLHLQAAPRLELPAPALRERWTPQPSPSWSDVPPGPLLWALLQPPDGAGARQQLSRLPQRGNPAHWGKRQLDGG